MPLIKWEPFANDLEQVFDDFAARPLAKLSTDLLIDIYEQNGDMIAKMHIPDVDPKQIDISIADQVLHVSGARSEEKEIKDEFYFRREIRSGSFARSVRLPKPVIASDVVATYKNGVLKIKMPLAKEVEESRIKVQIE